MVSTSESNRQPDVAYPNGGVAVTEAELPVAFGPFTFLATRTGDSESHPAIILPKTTSSQTAHVGFHSVCPGRDSCRLGFVPEGESPSRNVLDRGYCRLCQNVPPDELTCSELTKSVYMTASPNQRCTACLRGCS